jgi:hypothetical protein
MSSANFHTAEVAICDPDGKVLAGGTAGLILQQLDTRLAEVFDLEVLYVGQAWGAAEVPTTNAAERLTRHETLLAIYAESEKRAPDQDIWLLLLSLDPPLSVGAMTLGKTPVHIGGYPLQRVSDRHYVNFTEAALIRYFQPPYNKVFKNTFPNPAHGSYEECYSIDLNSVGIELVTDDVPGLRLYSERVPRTWYHIETFFLHDPAAREAMFDFGS